MLILSRRENQRIRIGADIMVVVTKIEHGKVWIGIDAPPDVLIDRPDAKSHDQRDRSVTRETE